MDPNTLFPLLIVVGLFVVLVKEWLEPDVAAWAAVGVILVTGLMPVADVLSALANPAPVTVGCMFILGSALEKTGVVSCLAHNLGRVAGKTEGTVQVVLCGFACLASAVINNTAVVVVMMPVALAMARAARFSSSKILMPLSYAAILGGTCSLIGTSSNLSVQGVLRAKGETELGFFEFTPLGLIYAAVGVVYLMTVGRRLLPDHGIEEQGSEDAPSPWLVQYVVTEDSMLVGHTLVTTLLAKLPNLDVLEVRRRGVPLHDRLDSLGIRVGDRILLAVGEGGDSDVATIEDAAAVMGLRMLEARESGVLELVVPSGSEMTDIRLGEVGFRQRYAVRVSRLIRDGKVKRVDLGNEILEPGDQLQVTGPVAGLDRLVLDSGFAPVKKKSEAPVMSRSGWIVAGLFALFVVGSALHDVWPSVFHLGIEGMAMLAVVILLLSRAVPHKEIYADVNWSIVFLISGMLIVGIMLENTGTARLMAMGIAGVVGEVPGWMIVSLTYLGAMILTELISNNAVATMFTPVAINLAHELGVESRPLIMAVLFATSASFATPVGYQTNTLIYGVGGYRFSDFVRVGLPLNVILWIVASILIPLFWPL